MCFIIQISSSDSTVIHTEDFHEVTQRIYKLPLEEKILHLAVILLWALTAFRENEVKIPQILTRLKS